MKENYPFSFMEEKTPVAALTQGTKGSNAAGPYHLSTGF
jgi:hypothetical protein